MTWKLVGAVAKHRDRAASSFVTESGIGVLTSFTGYKAAYLFCVCCHGGKVMTDNDQRIRKIAGCVRACIGRHAVALLGNGFPKSLI